MTVRAKWHPETGLPEHAPYHHHPHLHSFTSADQNIQDDTLVLASTLTITMKTFFFGADEICSLWKLWSKNLTSQNAGIIALHPTSFCTSLCNAHPFQRPSAKASSLSAEGLWFNSWPSYTSDFKTGKQVANLHDAWQCGVSARTGRPRL